MKKIEKIVKIFKKIFILKMFLITFLVIALSILFIFMQKMKLSSVKINNKNLNISYIDGADHSYDGKELILTDEILSFIRNINF